MRTCDYCGEAIEFRYVDGRPTPIHVNGGWCSGHKASSVRSAGPFQSVESYVNPNAHCPVCHKPVIFYRSPFGGRVFFESLGWPWPKHPCTDNPKSQVLRVEKISGGSRYTFRSAQGESLELHKLVLIEEDGDLIRLKFQRLTERVAFKTHVSLRILKTQGLDVRDLQLAPSFVVRTYDSYRLVEFISGGTKKIEALKLTRLKP